MKKIVFRLPYNLKTCHQIMWSYLWSELPDVPSAVNKGVYVPTAKRKVFGMFPTSGSGKVIFLYDEQQKKYLLAQCERLMARRWHEDVGRLSAGDWLREFFLLIFDYRPALLALAYHFNLHHFSPIGFRWNRVDIVSVVFFPL